MPIAIVGMVVPFALGFLLGWTQIPDSDWKVSQCLFLGVALSITAVPVAAKVLMDLDLLHTRIGRVVITAAIFDDILSLVLLAALTAILENDEALSAASLTVLCASVVAFFAVVWLFGRYLLPRAGQLFRSIHLEHAGFTVPVVLGLMLAVLAEWLGMHFLIGAFAAGVLFSREIVGRRRHARVMTQIEALTLGFLAPVFFASIGIQLDLSAITEIPVFLVLLLVAATLGKLAGAGFAARFMGFSGRRSLAVGASMNARGAVEIIVAEIAAQAGLFAHPDPIPPEVAYLFSAIVIMAVVTTIGSPILLKWSLSGAGSRESA
jgi:Kef-type K+ transport system membrane component KefB